GSLKICEVLCFLCLWKTKGGYGHRFKTTLKTLSSNCGIMVQEMDRNVPEELYNLTQLADVTLAAGKLNTTNLEQVQEFIKEEKIFDYSRKYPVAANDSNFTGIQSSDFHPIFTTSLKPLNDPYNNKIHSVIKANPPNEQTNRTGNLMMDKQSNFSSSEDDSSYIYSHKIFDKRKSRKLSYQSDDSECELRRFNSNRFSLFVDKNVPEIEDSLLSSETESHDCMEMSKITDSTSSGEDVHVCPECGKKYSTSSNLARHRQTHRSLMDKKARRCPHCDKVYVSMPAFSMHVRTHNQGCECPHCGKRFSRPWLLQGHIRTHTGEKPFPCNICAKAFADKSNLRAHVQTHSNTKPHTCSRCGKAFALKSYLYKHEESSCMRNIKPTEKPRPKPYRPDATKATIN
ncbi:Transcriptional repressor scratch 2, partial [Pseudolycoriella hygida]